MRFALIDLGTNSVRLDIYQLSEEKRVKLLLREKAMVSLGEALFHNGVLKPHAMKRTLRVLADFSDILRALGVLRVSAFATSAIRDAKNGHLFLRHIKRETGLSFKILPGLQEAKLIAEGILPGWTGWDDSFALVDIGGGSTEISICKNSKILKSASFKLGSLRLQELFLKDNPPRATRKNPDPLKNLKRHIEELLLSKFEKENWLKVEYVVGSSGTINALRRLIQKQGEKAEPFKLKSLSLLIEKMALLTYEELLKLSGMQVKRADQILAGAVLLETTMECLGAKKVFTTDFSLRDGLLLRELQVFQRSMAQKDRAG